MKGLNFYWRMFVDVWRLFKRFCNPDGSNEFWKAFVRESDRLNKQYQESELYQDLANAVTKELLKIEKEVQKK